MSYVEKTGGFLARWSQARRYLNVGDVPTDTDLPGDTKPEETKELKSTRM